MYYNVLPCPSISDHDAPYMTAKIATSKYQTRYKLIRDMENFDLQKHIDDFKQLPFLIVCSFHNPGDQLNILNKIIYEFIERRTPLKEKNYFALQPLG